MVKGTSAASNDTSPDVEGQRQTGLTGGLLKTSIVLPTKVFGWKHAEFVQLKKGDKWLIHAVCGPMDRQRGLRRTNMVDDLITAALAAVEGDEALDEALDEAALAVAIDDAPRPHDPMVDFSYGDEDSPPQEAGDSDNTSKKKKKTTPPRRSANMAVTVEMPDKCRDKYPKSTGVRQVACYVEVAMTRGKEKVWISVDDLPWLVRLMHDQFCLGGVSLLPEQCSDDSETLAMAGCEESAAADLDMSWDFVASAWVAAGRRLKLDEVSPREAAALGVDEAAWRDLSYAGKKELAYKSWRHWLEGNQ